MNPGDGTIESEVPSGQHLDPSLLEGKGSLLTAAALDRGLQYAPGEPKTQGLTLGWPNGESVPHALPIGKHLHLSLG